MAEQCKGCDAQECALNLLLVAVSNRNCIVTIICTTLFRMLECRQSPSSKITWQTTLQHITAVLDSRFSTQRSTNHLFSLERSLKRACLFLSWGRRILEYLITMKPTSFTFITKDNFFWFYYPLEGCSYYHYIFCPDGATTSYFEREILLIAGNKETPWCTARCDRVLET